MQAFANLRPQVPAPGVAEEVVPDSHRIFVEVGALDDGEAESQEGIKEKGRQGQLIGLVVVAMSRPQILGKGFHPTQAGSGRQRVTGDLDLCGHLGNLGVEVVAVPGHELLGESEDVAVQPEEVPCCVVVLETVEASQTNLILSGVLCGRFPEHPLQAGKQLVACALREFRLVLWRHVVGTDGLDHFFQ